MWTKLKKVIAALQGSEKRLFVAASVIGALAALSLIVVLINAQTKSVPARGGEYTEGMVGQPAYVNPVLAASDTDRSIARLLFANLHDIAEKIEVDKTGRVWKVRLKEGLAWSDGERLTSDDVVFTVERIQDPDLQSPLFLSWQGVTANRLSELEVQFNLVSPYVFFKESIDRLAPVPKHVFGDIPSANWRFSNANLQPVSSGAYAFDGDEKKSNGFISLYRVKSNARATGSRPFIQTISFMFFTKADDLLGAFNSGLVDGFGDAEHAAALGANRPHETFAFTLPGYYAVFWNQSQNLALKELTVRQTLDRAVDRTALLAAVPELHALPVTGPVAPSMLAPENSSTTPGSLKAAQEMLDAAGWKLNADGGRERAIAKKSSLKLEFTLTVPKIPFLVDTATYLKKTWETLGARVTLATLDPAEVATKTIKNREYQAILFGNSAHPPEDLYSFWHSNERFYPGLNLALYSNKKADQLLEAIRGEGDPEKRREKLGELRDVLQSDSPAVFLYSPEYDYLATRGLKGIEAGFIEEPADRFQDVEAWYLKTTRALK